MSSLGNFELALLLDGLHVSVAKVGGGTPGRRYTGDWTYEIRRGRYTEPVLMHGRDLRTDRPSTHQEAAKLALRMYRGI